MGGIVNSFSGGVGDAMKMLGMEAFRANLRNERDEANGMRKRTLQDVDHVFKADQNMKNRNATAEENKLNRQNRLDVQAAKPAKNPQLIKYTTKDGREMEGILQKNENGTYDIIKPGTEQIMEDEITDEELKNMQAKINVGKKWHEFDVGKKDPEVRVAVMAEKKKAESGGIVNNAAGMNKKTAPQAALDAVRADPKRLPEFIKKYGFDPTKQ